MLSLRNRLALRWATTLGLATATCLPAWSRAYERDLHYYATFALAVAAGWEWDNAHVIASANQGVDENKETVAALETTLVVPLASELALGAIKGELVHQAPQDFLWHAFSPVAGDNQLFLKEVESELKNCQVGLDRNLQTSNGKPTLDVLISLGVQLHCQQDAGSHQGYGGKCGNFPGNCTAHTWASFRDNANNRRNPDHPIVKPEANLFAALKRSASALARVRAATGNQSLQVKDRWLRDLVVGLRRPEIARMEDGARIDCHAEAAGEWLLRMVKDGAVKMPPQAGQEGPSVRCGAQEPHIPIPPPAYPKLDWSAHGKVIGDKYDTVRGVSKFDLAIDQLSASQRCNGIGCRFKIRVQVSNLGPSSSQSSLVLLAILPPPRPPASSPTPPFGAKVKVGSIGYGNASVVEIELGSPYGEAPLPQYLVYGELQAPIRGESSWLDANISNDTLACVDEGKGASCSSRDKTLAR